MIQIFSIIFTQDNFAIKVNIFKKRVNILLTSFFGRGHNGGKGGDQGEYEDLFGCEE